MKVMHLVRALDVGGLERVVLDLVETGGARGISAHIACLHHAGAWGRDRDDLTVIPGQSRLAKAFHLARLARRLGIDVLHSHNPEPHLVAVLAGILCRRPVVHTKHGRNYPGNRRRVWLNRWLNRMSAVTVAVSGNAASVARDVEHCPGHKLAIIHNGVNARTFSPPDASHRNQLRERLGIPGDAFVIGSVGRLSPEKNYPLLLEAFAQFAGMREHCRLVIVGDGGERERLQQESERLGIGGACHFAGDRRDVADWLGAFDLFCLSSLTEGLSITLLEAGACGLACVVTDVGGNREVVRDGWNGLLVPSREAGALSDAFRRLHDEPVLREDMGRHARAQIEDHFSLEAMMDAYLECYRKVKTGEGR